MMKSLLVATVGFGLLAGAAAASDLKYAAFQIRTKKTTVSATVVVGGYTEAQVARFIADHCAGQSSALAPKGKPRKRRGHVLQKYVATCTGGPNRRIIDASSMAVEVEQTDTGKTMYEYTYSDEAGNLQYKRILR